MQGGCLDPGVDLVWRGAAGVSTAVLLQQEICQAAANLLKCRPQGSVDCLYLGLCTVHGVTSRLHSITQMR